MRIAIVGGGISGNLAARLLSSRHEVRLFEAADYVGGHTNTVEVEAFGQRYKVDTGFMVFNEHTYPNFVRLLQHLGIESQNSEMSFSVRCDRTGLEYQGSSMNGLFAQRTNLLRPRFYRMLRDVLRFNQNARLFLEREDDYTTLRKYLADEGYRAEFVEKYLIPMCAAIWSARPDRVLDMPARFLIQFFHNHGLMQIRNRPQWKTIAGGARTYVSALLEPLQSQVVTGCPVQSVLRHEDAVEVATNDGGTEFFDEVVLAVHADQALEILGDASSHERDILSAFPYQKNDAVLHTDSTKLPRSRRAWASWNYRIPSEEDQPVIVTYDVNHLQRLGAPAPICVTLNDDGQINDEAVLRRFTYQHPVFGSGTLAAQRRWGEISGRRHTHYCGAYWRYGFHEDGVVSALAVARTFGLNLEDMKRCKAASTEAAFAIGGASQ